MNGIVRPVAWKSGSPVQALNADPVAETLRQDIKDGTARLIKAAGGLDPLAVDPGVRARRAALSNYQNINRPEFAPIDVIVSLEELTGRDDVTALMCRRRGGVFLPVAETRQAAMPLASRCGRIGGAATDLIARLGAALGGGCLEPREARAIRAKAAVLMAELAATEAALGMIEAGAREDAA